MEIVIDTAPKWIAAIAATGALVKVLLWAGSVNTQLKTLNDFMQEMRAKLDKMMEWMQPQVSKTTSPLRLTDFGSRVSRSISAGKWASKHALKLADQVSGKRPFEIFEMCKEYVEEMSKDEDLKKRMQEGAYEHGIDMDQIKEIYRIYSAPFSRTQ